MSRLLPMNVADAARLLDAGSPHDAAAACRAAIFVDAGAAPAHHLLALWLAQARLPPDAVDAIR